MGAISVLIGASVTHSRVPVHIVNMKLLVLAACVALSAAWQPGPRDLCNNVNTEGGSAILPHEKYCQLYYTCDLRGTQTTLFCPGRMLFAYGVGIGVCVTEGFSTFNCPKRSCSSQNDVGRRYPDTCCGKYWECTAPNQLSEKECNPGTRFDMNSESCQPNAICEDNEFCIDNRQPSNINDCINSASLTGDSCKYRTQGWPFDRQCPLGTSFDTSTCQCSQFSTDCLGSNVSPSDLIENKTPDVQCRASGRVSWSNLGVFSDKLNGRQVDHYFYRSPGFTSSSLEGVFTSNNFIYDYFYNDNTLYAPLLITMMVRFDTVSPQLSTEYVFLENRWSTDPSNTHCQTTLKFSAAYNGVIRGDRSWRFNIQATGENNQQSSGSASISGQSGDYFRIRFTFGTTIGSQIGIGGSVTNYGTNGQFGGISANFNTDNRNMGSAIKPTKCGFAIGRGLNGRVREFNVYEGCSNFALQP